MSKEKCKCIPPTNFEKVKEFHEVFGCNIGDNSSPGFVDSFEPVLRLKLIKEEYEELLEAIEKGQDNEKIAKELVDLLYVVYGTGVAMGLDLDRAFDLVHTSNLSKLDDDGNPIYNSYGKVIKSVNYLPPNLSELTNGREKA